MAALMHPHLEPAPQPRLRLVTAHPGAPSADRAEATAAADDAVYRRRRLTVGVAALTLLWALALLASAAVGWFTGPTAGAIVPEPAPRVHIVQPGDTLWSVALLLDDDGDVRDTVDRLAEINGGAALMPGQRLLLPAG